MSNETLAGEIPGMMLQVYKARIAEMLEDPDKMNVGLLKEAREFLKQHDIQLDANDAPMQDLTDDVNELAAWKAKRNIA